MSEKLKSPRFFRNEEEDKITFKTTQVNTLGIDWYQVNGKLSIKGVEKEVKLFVTGIRDSKDVTMASALVLEGNMNLFDWGIDYDKIVTGKSDMVSTKWMHLNMKIDLF